MSFANHAANIALRRVSSDGLPAGLTHGFATLCARVHDAAPAESAGCPSGSTAPLEAARTAQQRVRKAEGEWRAHEPQGHSLDPYVDPVGATAQQSLRAHSVEVSLAEPAGSRLRGARSGADRWQAAARLADPTSHGSDPSDPALLRRRWCSF
jgi:hypothetical protein